MLKTLVEFTGASGPFPGGNPDGRLMLAPDGFIYGTTLDGPGGYGTIFRLSLAGEFTSILTFTGAGGAAPGFFARGPLRPGPGGSLWGQANSQVSGGSVFRLDGTVLTTLVTFDATYGQDPCGLTMGLDGNFYGVCKRSSTNVGGTFFRITPSGVATHLRYFNALGVPDGPPVLEESGDFVVATDKNLLRVTTAGDPTVLTDTGNAPVDIYVVRNPSPFLLREPDGGIIYAGTTDGVSGKGAIVRRAPSGGLGLLSTLENDAASLHGRYPTGGLTRLADGSIYGAPPAIWPASKSRFGVVRPDRNPR